MPRQSPQKPPNPEMKSIQVIFFDLSNSGGNLILNQGFESFTHQTLKSHQKRYSQLQYHFCRHRSTHFPGRSTCQRKKACYRNSTFMFLWWVMLIAHWALPWWVMIPLLFHPSSLGTSVSSALSFRWHIQSSGSRKSLGRLVATLPKMWGSCYKTGSCSSSVNHMS